jgi:hypothetical protein
MNAFSEVDWEVTQKIDLEASPIDVAVSLDDRWIFILNNNGEVLVYSKDGVLNDTLNVGKYVSKIKVGPHNNQLFLQSKKKKTVEMVELDFIWDINVEGSPFKGPADAPVVITLFTDFQ